MTTHTYRSAAHKLVNSKNLAMKPLVKGMPAKPKRKTEKQIPSKGFFF